MEKGKGISPGCMVILTKAVFPENIGRIGTAIEIFKDRTPHGRMWTVQFATPLRSVYQEVSEVQISNKHENPPTTIIQHPEPWMRRIDGDADDIFGEEDTMKPTSTVGEMMKENMDRYGVEA